MNCLFIIHKEPFNGVCMQQVEEGHHVTELLWMRHELIASGLMRGFVEHVFLDQLEGQLQFQLLVACGAQHVHG